MCSNVYMAGPVPRQHRHEHWITTSLTIRQTTNDPNSASVSRRCAPVKRAHPGPAATLFQLAVRQMSR